MRLALTYPEAAEALGVSLDSFQRHVMPHLRLVNIGARVVVPVAELERFLEERAV